MCIEQSVVSSSFMCTEFIRGCLTHRSLNIPLRGHRISTGLFLDSHQKHIVQDILASIFNDNVFCRLCFVFERQIEILSSRCDSISRLQGHHLTRRNHDRRMVCHVCPTSPPLILRRSEWKYRSSLTTTTIWICAQCLQFNCRIFETGIGKNIDPFAALCLWLAENDAPQHFIRPSYFSQETSILQFHGIKFPSHCRLFSFDKLNLPFGPLQSSLKVVVCCRQGTKLCNDDFQPLRRRLYKKGTLPCFKGESTGHYGNSITRSKPSAWSLYLHDGIRAAALLRVGIVQDKRTWRNPTRTWPLDREATWHCCCWVRRGMKESKNEWSG